jgi:hypothetical protein
VAKVKKEAKEDDFDFGLDGETAEVKPEKTAIEKPAEKPIKTKTEPPELVPVMQKHLCSWCGGYEEAVFVAPRATSSVPEFVDGVRLPIKEKDGNRAVTVSLHACGRCVFRVYNNILGVAPYKGKEIKKWEKTNG